MRRNRQINPKSTEYFENVLKKFLLFWKCLVLIKERFCGCEHWFFMGARNKSMLMALALRHFCIMILPAGRRLDQRKENWKKSRMVLESGCYLRQRRPFRKCAYLTFSGFEKFQFKHSHLKIIIIFKVELFIRKSKLYYWW